MNANPTNAPHSQLLVSAVRGLVRFNESRSVVTVPRRCGPCTDNYGLRRKGSRVHNQMCHPQFIRSAKAEDSLRGDFTANPVSDPSTGPAT